MLWAGCNPRPSVGPPPAAQTYRVAITQIVTHPGIDAVREGFLSEMKRQGFIEGKDVTYELTNANGEFTNAQMIARKIAGDKLDLVFTISTPSTQAVIAALKGKPTPVVFGSITDPVGAKIVSDLKKPGGYVTGTTDVWPYDSQFSLLKTLLPRVKRVGVIFNPSEANAQSSMKLVRASTSRHSLQLVEVSISSSGEVPAAARSLVGRVDAIYVPADNTVISAIASVVKVSEQYKVPLMPGDTSNVEVGGFGTVGHSYFEVGVESGKIAAKILKGGKPGDIEVTTSNKDEYYFNVKSARATGVRIPDEFLKKAVKVYGSS